MTGMSRTTGEALNDDLPQSVADILGAPIGTRVGLRDYGSLIPELMDRPMTRSNILRIYAASAVALSRWEDRLRLQKVSLAAGAEAGSATLTLDGVRTDTGAVNSRTRLVLPL